MVLASYHHMPGWAYLYPSADSGYSALSSNNHRRTQGIVPGWQSAPFHSYAIGWKLILELLTRIDYDGRLFTH
ncbi:MAG: hypothetical protein ACYC27_19575 [Armatimonadota bacterium]